MTYQIKNAAFAYKPSLMFKANGTFTFGREPTLRRMPDGSLISLIYTGGKKEPHPDNCVGMIRSLDDGKTWTVPEVIFKHPYRCTWGTEICTETETPFCVFHTFSYEMLYNEIRTFFSFTKDFGRTWSEPNSPRGLPPVIFRQIKKLSDNSLLAGVYWQEQRSGWNHVAEIGLDNWHPGWHWVSGAVKSSDGGKTWSLHGYFSRKGGSLWEPEVIELEDGHLLMGLRSAVNGILYKTESFDYGNTWTEAVPSDIPNPGSKFVFYKVKKRIVLVNNFCTPENRNRYDLQAWVSDDLCRSWRRKLQLVKICAPSNDNPDIWENPEEEFVPQAAYPHGFADDEKATLYLSVDCILNFFMIRIPYSDLI